MNGSGSKVGRSMEIVRLASEMSREFYSAPPLVAYSGGKDSDALVELFLESGVEFEVEHSVTTVDAPQTMAHIRRRFSRLKALGIRCEMLRPTYKGEPTSMWKLIPEKLMPPTRLVRYCCSVLKERSTPNRLVALGVRGGNLGRGACARSSSFRERRLRTREDGTSSTQPKSTTIPISFPMSLTAR